MKKILIGVGVLIIVILLAVWLYLSTAGQGGGTFADFGFGDTTDESVDIAPFVEEDPISFEIPDEDPLRQITTIPVVGHTEVRMGTSSSPLIYYVEAGTSHVFRVDTVSYESLRLSNTTITNVQEAVFSADGQYVALANGEITVLTLPSSVGGEVSAFTIFERAEAMTVIGNTLLYLTETPTGSAVKRYDLGSRLESETLFTIPFREVTITWGDQVSGPHFYYPKPAQNLMGYLYSWQNGTVAREPIADFDLTALQVAGLVLYRSADSGLTIYSGPGTEQQALFLDTIPDKCSQELSAGPLVCAAPTNLSVSDHAAWRRGEITTTDELVLVDLGNGQTRAFTEALSIDVVNLKTVSSGLLFTNRPNGNLWHYRADW